MKVTRILASVLALGISGTALFGCGSEPPVPATAPTESPTVITAPPTSPPSLPPTEPLTLPPDPAVVLLEQLTLREKVGQLFIVRPDALDFSVDLMEIEDGSSPGVCGMTDEFLTGLQEYPVGGLAMFSKNLTDPEQIQRWNQSLSEQLRIPLFLAVDEEGGMVARLANHDAFDLPRYSSAGAVGSSGNPEDGWEMGYTIGSYLKEYGFHMDFAPVADVNTNPYHPVIGNRAFSSDPKIAALLARACADGLQDAGIIPVFKHFPGHGDTQEDSHFGIAICDKTEAELASCEWLPYQDLSHRDCVMVGHIALPNLLGDETPATMSRQVVTGILRQKLQFDGLILTDSLSMGAITQRYSSAEAALTALDAGCDILLMPYDLREAFDAVLEAVETGVYPEDRLDETVLKLIRFKMAYGLL